MPQACGGLAVAALSPREACGDSCAVVFQYKVLSVLPGSGMGIAVSTPSTQKPLVFGAMVHRDEAFETIFSQYMKITSAAASGGDS
ncbi:PREDICTED: GRAM domain-containing protein 4-like [Galeopterus variegatus]|uniref:GRAM domain-containing protein 4-like n=1 Tax=Galeopterus variegatus TaxID=482537 RepID=A0ABM0S500_GALVR|nr:PREDICTED: GRAM domain-containing protein 4-like [Galeopterus variegatus]